MNSSSLHDWDVTPKEAVKIQEALRPLIRIEPFKKDIRLIGAADVSYNRFSSIFFAAFVVLEFPSLRVVASSDAVMDVKFPYVPGLLSFRELPVLLKAWEKLNKEPDVLVFDGQGIAHPRRMGIATHMGLVLDRPTIGCGKSLLTGHYEEPNLEPGSTSPLIDRGEQVGVALRTKTRAGPVFVSPGHRMDIESSVRILMSTVRGYRIPEPTRQAHNWVNQCRVQAGISAAV